MMLSFRCNNFERHLRKTDKRNEDRFGCRVFGFVQVNQVTTRANSELVLIEDRARSLLRPMIFFSDKHRNHTRLHLSQQRMNTNHVSSC